MIRNRWEQSDCPSLRDVLVALALVALVSVAVDVTRAMPDPSAVVCGSDMDCMRLCPSSDLKCDGGPEPEDDDDGKVVRI